MGNRALLAIACANLRALTLSRTAIHDEDLANLANCRELDILRVDETEVTGSFLKYCCKLPRLRWLGASGNKSLSGLNFRHVKGPFKLRILNLSKTKVGDDSEFLSSLSKLEALFLRKTNVTDRVMNAIASMRTLEVIDLADTVVSDKGVDLLLNLEKVNRIDLSGTFVSPKCTERLKKKFKNLNCVYAYPPASPDV